MTPELQLRRFDHLSFKGNLKHTRYGWLRLTPAYSVHLVAELLDQAGTESRVLDPFCGTGTTALVCAQKGLACDTTDINPFLVWLARAKAQGYLAHDLQRFRQLGRSIAQAMRTAKAGGWTPDLHQIEKWWDHKTLAALGEGMAGIKRADAAPGVVDLLKIAFCRTLIERANVSFGHQSMSFKKGSPNLELIAPDGHMVAETWLQAVEDLIGGAATPVLKTPRIILLDARHLDRGLKPAAYDLVITSPPYPNRMSYIRELRPYMYWLGYLSDGRAAGELDWQAIGGTWGCATSNVGKWKPADGATVPFRGFHKILEAISKHSPLLANYVQKYFVDMVEHVSALARVVAPGGAVHYVVGNSKFYDVLLPVEQIFAALFEAAGFEKCEARAIRKRSSKKELFEYIVSAWKPSQRN
jgi:hypothetical protein